MCIMLSYFYLQERRGKIADLWLAIRLGVFFALFSLKDTLSYFDTVKKCIGAYHSRDGGNLRLYGICGWFPAYAGMTMHIQRVACIYCYAQRKCKCALLCVSGGIRLWMFRVAAMLRTDTRRWLQIHSGFLLRHAWGWIPMHRRFCG